MDYWTDLFLELAGSIRVIFKLIWCKILTNQHEVFPRVVGGGGGGGRLSSCLVVGQRASLLPR